MERAFALVASGVPSIPDRASRRDSERNMSFATWDEPRLSLEEGLAALRRDRLKRYVTATMGGSVLILIAAMIRFAIGGSGTDDEEITRATFAKMREVPAEIAALPHQLSTLTARTQAALKIEHRKEMAKTVKQTTARASKFW